MTERKLLDFKNRLLNEEMNLDNLLYLNRHYELSFFINDGKIVDILF